MMLKPCPCGSGLYFRSCCQPYLSGKQQPKTALALMRARYTAFTKAKVSFIHATQISSDNAYQSQDETKSWTQQVKWLGLTIIDTQQGLEDDEEGYVHFIAKYRQPDGQVARIEENSFFKKTNDQWAYIIKETNKE